MTTPKKHYSPAFKSQVVQEVLAGNKTLTQIASDHGIHPNVITKWKRAALSALPDTFDERTVKQIAALIERYEKEKEELYAQIGRLTTELRWLEKKSEAGFAQIKSGGVDRTRLRPARSGRA
jgi:putative transposase